MEPIPNRFQHIFVVRVWSEVSGSAPMQWRGSVEHAVTRERLYFTSLVDLSDFIRFHLDATPLLIEPDSSKGE